MVRELTTEGTTVLLTTQYLRYAFPGALVWSAALVAVFAPLSVRAFNRER